MRLHHLRVTAFGPFAGEEEVDFDELCDAGLFLLTGPTGAGKTTILDAVCFALYGSVPGVRGVKALKSQHAADDLRPEVVLDFSVRDRRFVVRRSPEWSRPKRRGKGLTTENASATLVETTSGEDHLLSSRAQEVGHFIGELVGMQATQFVQVAMLPQGDFQKFLRASSQERHAVLEHLFRTDRFSRIEDWVHEHSRTLKDRSAHGESAVVRVLDTIAERAGAELPENLEGDGLSVPEAQQRALAWAAGLVEVAEASRVSARDQLEATSRAADEARTRHQEGQRLRIVLDRRDQAQAVLAALEHEGEAADEAHQCLAADERARRCAPLLRMLDAAVADAARAADARDRAAERLHALELDDLSLPSPVTAAGLEDLEQQVRSRATRLEALLPREAELLAARRDLRVAETAVARAEEDLTVTSARQEAVPVSLAAARERLTASAASARRAEALAVELGQARRRHDAAREAEVCADSLLLLGEAEREARDRVADAREQVQELTARRLAGIAAELAGRLEDGRACQVCGSTSHPYPAQAGPDAVTESEQAEAQADHETAREAYTAAAGEVLKAKERLEGLRAVAESLTVDKAEARVEELTAELSRAREAEADVAVAEQSVDELTREREELTSRAHELTTRIATSSQAVSAHRRTIEIVTAELAAVLDLTHRASDDGRGGLSEEVARLEAIVAALSEVRDALGAHERAATRVAELELHAQESAAEHGFDGLTALRGSVLDDDERARLAGLLETRAERSAGARAVLDEEEVRTLADHTQPDLSALVAALREAEEAEASATKVLHRLEEVASALARQLERLEEAFIAWAPVREEFTRAESMSRLVRGMGADNQLQIRLSAYVLATRLDQVVAAANERLAHMRDQRYLLQRTGRAARKGAQAGLGLEVVDQWTGDVRDPTTLSGGETFVVSLALALGLADVVTGEAGGTEIETLFVDEGFGTLDADTLDDVMDRLDDLRAGGRAVGVVSHVGELRNRIPTQLHVEKRRNGSSVRVRTTVA